MGSSAAHPDRSTVETPGAADLLAALHARCRGRWTLMEVCGGQTHTIVRSGLDRLLPAGLELIHGPGCPVCVTPLAVLDRALELAQRPEVILCSYGDMLRVPGSASTQPGGGAAVGGDAPGPPPDLLAARAAGADVRLLTSPLQALQLARRHPEREVVFLAVGFETTAPATALLARQALALGVRNLSLLSAHVRVVPAMETILAAAYNRIQGFLAAGHVCAVMGTEELIALVRRWRVPVVVCGFTASEVLVGLGDLVEQLEGGRAELGNAYPAVVRPEGNPAARRLLEEVFEPVSLSWRGLGPIPAGGLALRGAYGQLEAHHRFPPPAEDARAAARRDGAAGSCPASGWGGPLTASEEAPCLAAAVLQGRLRPTDCPSFGGRCSPDTPLGAPMVSSEGACAAYWQYRR